MSRNQTGYEIFESSSEGNRRLLRQEELILKVTETLSELLEQEKVSKTDLARRLGKSKGFVSQILGGGRNLTLRTLSDVLDALGHDMDLTTSRRLGRKDLRVRFESALLDYGCEIVPLRPPDFKFNWQPPLMSSRVGMKVAS